MSEVFPPSESVQDTKLPTEREIDSGYLKDILSSPKVTTVLAKASEIIQNCGRETGFTVFLTQDMSVHIPGVALGTTDAVYSYDELDPSHIPVDGEPPEIRGELIDIHLHPDIDDLTPSTNDLNGLLPVNLESGERMPYEPPLFMAVGKVDETGKITLLAIHRPEGNVDSESIRHYGDTSSRYLNNYDTLRSTLLNLGYSSTLLYYEKTRGDLKLTEESIDNLKQLKTSALVIKNNAPYLNDSLTEELLNPR